MKYEQEEREEKGSVMKGNGIRAALKGAERRSKKKNINPLFCNGLLSLCGICLGRASCFKGLFRC